LEDRLGTHIAHGPEEFATVAGLKEHLPGGAQLLLSAVDASSGAESAERVEARAT
jgi:hypothetical protein